MRNQSFLFCAFSAASLFLYRCNHNRYVCDAAKITTSASAATGSSSSSPPVYRKNNLDYLNSDTLAHFLSYPPNLNYDAVILFYANWDHNSHNFAQLYAQIAQFLSAGSVESKVIMGLFDCEVDMTHMQLCTKAGITHYPTTLYFSFATRRHYKFGGNWQYGDAVLDWIKTLRALSAWHRAGWGRRLRLWLLGKSKRKTPKPELPLGISTGSSSSSSSMGGFGRSSSSSATPASADTLKEIENLRREKENSDEILTRSAAMMEAILFPINYSDGPETTKITDHNNNKTFTDLFAYLNQTAEPSMSWTATTPHARVLRSCVQDMSLEYCQRFTTIMAEEYLHAHPEMMIVDQTKNSNNNQELIADLSHRLEEIEPYCFIIDACILNGFVSDQCRPPSCPFNDVTACRFLTSCFYESMQQQYASALRIDLNNNNNNNNASSSSVFIENDALQSDNNKAKPETKKKKKTGWMFGG